MKYYLIVGEASGDLHASRLMRSLKQQDAQAEFRFFGGDLMQAEGGTLVKHYRELAYMGIVPVLLHLPTILSNMRLCKRNIREWQPDVVILVDYPSFNLGVAKYVKTRHICPVYYYISPKIWAWKEYRIRSIRRYVDEMFSILPFEVPFYEGKHHYPIHYVGNPTADEVREFLSSVEFAPAAAARPLDARYQRDARNSKLSTLNSKLKPVLLLPGSRKQEIKDNLPAMLQATDGLDDYQRVIAGAPGIDRDYYGQFLGGHQVEIVFGQTFQLLSQAHAALVTSGTATLETALFRVPQVVCYETPLPWLISRLRRIFIKVKYISLVNLIADREVVPELVADTFSVDNIRRHLLALLDGPAREQQLQGYDEIIRHLGDDSAPDNAARIMFETLYRAKKHADTSCTRR